ncbi:hypothetical protein DYB25_004772 [Aphanomyces astaci]|uniref:Choline transporter-like protein n=2 Tax=Aphanomyces astaci TaxID=112090 RepID=A0A397CSA4_APHAT|nr:hypothetical protein DYB25_004772 [Aphanomyces astaci]RHY50975.1 hypothetical protein DYB38_006857 [Aphanomyces astaci]
MLGKPEPAPPGNHRHGSPPPVHSMRLEKPAPKCNDAFFAILFVGHLVAIAYFAFTSGLDYLKHFESEHPSQAAHKSFTMVLGVSGGLIGFAVVFSALWIQVLMACAENMIRFALWMNVGMMFGFAIMSMFVNPFMGLFFLLGAAINICYINAVQNRIAFASAHLKLACVALSNHKSIFALALLFIFVQVAWLVTWSLSAVGVYQLFRSADPSCEQEESRGELCGGAGFNVTIFFLLVSVYWGQQVIQNVMTCTVAGTVATWWYNARTESAVAGSLYRSLTSSFGSICFGSLIVAVLQALRTIVRTIKNKAAEDDNVALACVACLAECILNCIESLVEYFNMWAYTYVGIYGFDFRSAGKAVMQLFDSRGWTAVINDDLSSTALSIGAFGVGVLTGVIGLVVAKFAPVDWTKNTTGISFVVIFGGLGFIAGFSMAMILANLVITALHTIFVCFAEDPVSFQRSHPEHYNELILTWRHFQPDALVAAYGSASGVTAAQLQGADAVTNAIKLCQYPACQAFFASLASLKCTDAAGNPVSGASGVCSALPKSTGVSTFLASAPMRVGSCGRYMSYHIPIFVDLIYLKACMDVGFFYLEGHRIPIALQNAVYEQMKQFFHLPETEKRKASADKNMRGWAPMYEETLDPAHQSKGDTKEAYHVCRPSLPDEVHLPLHDTDNVFPDAHTLPQFKAVTTAYFNAMSALGLHVAHLFADAAGSPGYFNAPGMFDR